ncbi:type VI secretion system tip protein VgrG [Pedobacter sp. ISL-68]|uniref:type VI secretion system tip protein VgrG n=1 Tax=unclassified Pedobacter TaxID=2628915 RepID=UPI001BE719FF|nr:MULTISPECIES: type VI secretion system tip protein VgrG [unclassified Pedobacter]MBT2561609.1 type VI secretion system tip protein VgrG [Pedobacter sp. ISL-64]MBT2590998.1 type VI secretion system tip protein VgrG [Pedobacter sp. ISL-68]
MPANSGVQSFSITVNGQVLPDAVGILEIVVTNLVNAIPKAKVVVMDGSAAAQNFDLSNGTNFIPGAEISIAAGYNGENEVIFSGLIISQTIRANEDGSQMEIECRDKAVKLTAGRKNKIWEDTSDSDAITDLVGQNGITADIDGLDLQHKQLVQFNCSNWDFIVTRAELNSALVVTEAGKLIIGMPNASQESTATYTYGSEIYDFEAQMDARTQYPQVLTKNWNYTNQEVKEGASAAKTLPQQGNISGDDLAEVLGWEDNSLYHSGNVAEQESTEWATAQLFRSRLNRVIGNFRVQGDNKLKPGIIVELLGIGERFSGKCWVTGVIHSYSGEAAWYSHVQFGLDKKLHSYNFDDIVEKPATGIIPPVNGLQIGIVTQLESDPDGENRIRVRLPTVENEGDGIWARLASVDAGKEHGWVWNPEINDEVIIGFINDDPRDAVILGRLYSSSFPPHLEAKDDNYLKGLSTKSKLQVLFDDEKKIIKIETPGGNFITLDEDQKQIAIQDINGNKIEMSEDGIKIESIKDIILKASGDFKIDGTNITTNANAQLKLSGSAGTEVSSSAITKVKGSMVQIN